MGLTKIKTGGLADNSVTDAKVADAITVTGAQTGITEVGTLTAGTWNASVIASDKLYADTAHLSGTQTFSGAKTFTADIQITEAHPQIGFTDSDDNSDSRIYHSAGSLYIDADRNNEVGSSKVRFSVDDSEVLNITTSTATFAGDITMGDGKTIIGTTDSTNFGTLIGTDTSANNIVIGSTSVQYYNDIVFNSAGATGDEILRMKANGNVGIGTASPDYLLEVESNNPVIALKETDTGKSWRLDLASSKISMVETGVAEVMTWDAGDSVGIRTTSPASQMSANTVLEIKGSSIASLALQGAGSSRWELTSDNYDDFKVSRNGSTKLTIDGSDGAVTFAGNVLSYGRLQAAVSLDATFAHEFFNNHSTGHGTKIRGGSTGSHYALYVADHDQSNALFYIMGDGSTTSKGPFSITNTADDSIWKSAMTGEGSSHRGEFIHSYSDTAGSGGTETTMYAWYKLKAPVGYSSAGIPRMWEITAIGAGAHAVNSTVRKYVIVESNGNNSTSGNLNGTKIDMVYSRTSTSSGTYGGSLSANFWYKNNANHNTGELYMRLTTAYREPAITVHIKTLGCIRQSTSYGSGHSGGSDVEFLGASSASSTHDPGNNTEITVNDVGADLTN